jgi:cathepsin A (carboxypeptidase C)
MVWFTGGPGGSSQASALVENGDCSFDPISKRPKHNPHGWNEEFHMVYLDQPAGVGFSYIDDATNDDAYPDNTEDAAPDVVSFLRLFSEAFPQLAKSPLHLAGESYGGRCVPVYGDLVSQYNKLVPEPERIPLASLVVISGWTHPKIQIPTIFDVGCYEFKQYPAFLNTTACRAMEDSYQQCEMVLEACDSAKDRLVCGDAGRFCSSHMMSYVQTQNINKYDRRMHCNIPGQCYPVMDLLQDYMNSEAIFKDLLDVARQSKGLRGPFEFMSMRIFNNFEASGDMYMDSGPFVRNILTETDVPIFFTGGNVDVLVNTKGIRNMLEDIKWKGRPNFKNTPWEELQTRTKEGGSAGILRRTDRLWYAELENAGHMVSNISGSYIHTQRSDANCN